MFLNGFDKQETPPKLVKKNQSKKIETTTTITTKSAPVKILQNKKNLTCSSNDTSLTEFDKYLFNIDTKKKQTTSSQKPSTSNKCNKKPVDSITNAETTKSSESSNIDTLSFMKIMEVENDDANDETDTPDPDSNLSKILKGLDDLDSTKEPDYDVLSNKSDTDDDNESIDYETDEDEDGLNAIDRNKRKRRLKRTCMDDGDETLYLKRIRRLEKYEKSLINSLDENPDVSELEDLDDMSKSINDTQESDQEPNEADDLKIDLTNKSAILNNNRHYEIDSSFKIPENIWNKLYKFQKTGLKWLWELHTQRCGGILGDVSQSQSILHKVIS